MTKGAGSLASQADCRERIAEPQLSYHEKTVTPPFWKLKVARCFSENLRVCPGLLWAVRVYPLTTPVPTSILGVPHRGAIVLACVSDRFFMLYIKSALPLQVTVVAWPAGVTLFKTRLKVEQEQSST